MERDSEREAEREWERALAGEGERDLDLDFDLDLALDLGSTGECEREREPLSGSPPSSSLLGGSRPFEPDFLERSLIPDLERDLEAERDLDLDSSFLPFFPSFLLFLLLGLRLLLRSLFFCAPLLRSSSSFLPLLLFFLLWDRLREREAALRAECGRKAQHWLARSCQLHWHIQTMYMHHNTDSCASYFQECFHQV